MGKAPQKGGVVTMEMLRRFWTDEEGASLAEYAVLIALIVVVAIAAITAFGNNISALFNAIAAKISGVTPSP